jgi:hypothetical protein
VISTKKKSRRASLPRRPPTIEADGSGRGGVGDRVLVQMGAWGSGMGKGERRGPDQGFFLPIVTAQYTVVTVATAG